jgi:hypothetical protein
MLCYHRHLHFSVYADLAAARLPDLLAEEVRAVGDGRSAQRSAHIGPPWRCVPAQRPTAS